ncbi:MAG: manganese efflux pump, partial [Alphaproteobacteria bacterium]|nr:manganese efflux pump [Alphaproteobacteria bacterium]
LALGAVGARSRRWRILIAFGVFEFFVPLAGLWLGREVSELIADAADWTGPMLLAGLGCWALLKAREGSLGENLNVEAITSWKGLLALASGLSIDNLIVGFSIGLGRLDPLALATTIALFSIVFTQIGLEIGQRAKGNHEVAARMVAGLLLIALAVADFLGLV